jgi:hypothetical protein
MRVISATILLMYALIAGCNSKGLTDTSRSVSEADWAVQPMRELIGTHYDERLLNFVTMSDPETLSPGDLTIAGYAHYMGYGVPRDVARGLQLVRTSCEQGHMRGCALQGYFSAHSESYETRLESADVLTPTCDAGTFWACSTLVTVHAYGVGVDVDLDKAVMYANKSCEHPAERL